MISKLLMAGGVLLFLLLPPTILANHSYSGHFRYKRQFGDVNAPQIDLNITVPYIFSARLYPYGLSRGDRILIGQSQFLKLRSSIKFLGEAYTSVHIHQNGLISFMGELLKSKAFPIPEPVLAVYWMPLQGGKVYIRETDDPSILNLAQNEVNIQYRYGSSVHPTSVLIVTWEKVYNANDESAKADNINTFQIALIMSDLGTFAHIVYSKLNSNNHAIAGFNGKKHHHSLPGSGTSNAIQLATKSDIGIPGEFLYRIDLNQIHLCGSGYKWGLDCVRRCHCENSLQCNMETGTCPNGRCNLGWTGEPICEEDVDECTEQPDLCPNEQPDCMNTAGAYLCVCFEYDNETNECKGNASAKLSDNELIKVQVMSLQPKLASNLQLADSTLVVQTKDHEFSTVSHLNQFKQSSETIRFSPITIRPILRSTKLPCRCGANAECINGVCQCKSGWTGDGKFCMDINECFGEPSVCGPHSICDNNAGSYSCQCDIGYVSDESGKCVDMDECTEGVVVCSGGKNSSICVNTDGGYECRCALGYSGSPDSTHGCVDIDECQTSDFYCGEKGLCTNTIGAYECNCDKGFQRDSQNGHCVDTDECRYEPCDKAALCTNLYGTFKCSCIDGFVGNGVECHETILFPIERPTLHLLKRQNSLANFYLPEPIQIFGKQYSKLYITSNGGISFEAPPPMDMKMGKIKQPIFFPLSLNFTFDEHSNVAFKAIDETDTLEYSLLARSTLSVHSKFHKNDFRAHQLIIVLFEKMIEKNTDKVNSFQLVISYGKNATFLTYLYEEIESNNGFSGFTNGEKLFELPLELLLNNSNIGERGKWMFRIDEIEPIVCPAGTLDPPLCQKECRAGYWGFNCINKCHCKNDIPCDFATGFCSNNQCAFGWVGANCFEDIDECVTDRHNCTNRNDCINEIGSFRCKSHDPCYERFKEKCSRKAICDEQGPEEAECVCVEGYHGDGLNCLKINVTDTIENVGKGENIARVDGSLSIPKYISVNEDEIEATPFIMHQWITEGLTTVATTVRRIVVTAGDPVAKDYNEIDDDVFIGGRALDDSDSGQMWFIIAPIALCGAWVILTVVIIALCCGSKKKSVKYERAIHMIGCESHGAPQLLPINFMNSH